jgi:hypothetical protein
MAQITTEIINEFVEQIDNDKVYDLKELKQILSDIYKTKTAKPKKAPKLDKDGNEKPKRAPSAYNNYMKIRIQALKQEQPDTNARELLKMAAGEWKLLDKKDQEKYKTVA